MAKFTPLTTGFASGTNTLNRIFPVLGEEASDTVVHIRGSADGLTTVTGSGLSGGVASTTGVVTGWSFGRTTDGVMDPHFTVSGFNVEAKAFFAALNDQQRDKLNVLLFSGDDEMVGNEVENRLDGLSGDDTINGMGGADTISGGAGRGYLRGGAGDDLVDGGPGFDDAHGNEGADYLRGYGGGDWVVGGKDNDSVEGGYSNDIVYGNLGNDVLWGDNRVERLDDLDPTDKAADIVRGGQGDDVLFGGVGDDWLSGDRDNDTITGGRGADIFHSFGEAGLDQVTDFNPAEGDRILLDPGTTWRAEQVVDGVVVYLGGDGRLLLMGVSLSSLSGDWIVVG